ncbi:MAG: S26 family signal peptidase [Gemmatales bacterium]
MSIIPTTPPDIKPIKPEEPLYEEVRDSWRETFETVSFVVFLVLMLKAFVAEAYVIPTGSMATTLLGDHMHLQCPRCQQKYTVNASNGGQNLEQVQDDGGRKMLRFEGCCPNCQYVIANPVEGVDGGDKVLVLKPVYDMFAPERHETVVFKYPLGPQKDFGAYNYIKRLWGLPGEKLAIQGGDVYLVDEAGKLNIIRKTPDKMLRMRRIVNDNELLNPSHPQPLNTSWKPANERWETPAAEQTAWSSSEQGRQWNSKAKDGATSWLRYQHNFNPTKMGGGFAGMQDPINGPHIITDFLAYNHSDRGMFPHDWVGDLMVEAEVDVQAAQGTFILQLKKGVLNAEASFNLQSGRCTVTLQKEGKPVISKEADSSVNRTGKHLLRFANFDNRLTVWVGSKLLFDDGIDIALLPDAERGPRLADFVPVSLGTQNASVSVRKLSIWRDIYYSRDARNMFDTEVSKGALGITLDEFQTLAKQGDLHTIQRAEWLPYYPEAIQIKNASGTMGKPQYYPKTDPATHPSDRFGPDEYFMLGDNSLASQDSRDWGQVPRRMLLGRAIWVYWPYRNFSSIR